MKRLPSTIFSLCLLVLFAGVIGCRDEIVSSAASIHIENPAYDAELFYPSGMQSIMDELQESYGILAIIIGDYRPDELTGCLVGLKYAASLLPQSVLLEITKEGPDSLLRVVFEEDATLSNVAVAEVESNSINFNSLVCRSSQSYLVYAFVHEMGHIWDFVLRVRSFASLFEPYFFEVITKEKSFSSMAYRSGDDVSYVVQGFEGGEILMRVNRLGEIPFGILPLTIAISRDSPAVMDIHGHFMLINRIEDFADNFALYVLWSDYMKQSFPLRYQWFKDNVFRMEYKKNISPVPPYTKHNINTILN